MLIESFKLELAVAPFEALRIIPRKVRLLAIETLVSASLVALFAYLDVLD